MDPDFPQAHIWLGSVCATTGLYDEALASFSKVKNNAWALGWLGYVDGVSAYPEAEKLLGELKQVETEHPVDPHIMVIFTLGLERRSSFRRLGKGLRIALGRSDFAQSKSLYDSLRSDPRFADLLRRTNLLP